MALPTTCPNYLDQTVEVLLRKGPAGDSREVQDLRRALRLWEAIETPHILSALGARVNYRGFLEVSNFPAGDEDSKHFLNLKKTVKCIWVLPYVKAWKNTKAGQPQKRGRPCGTFLLNG